jgi:hypothetical protein
MALAKRGNHWYGDFQADIRTELLRYSEHNGYPAQHFADSECQCGSRRFRLRIDDTEGAALRVCTACGGEHLMGDSAEYVAVSELEECVCPCEGDSFEITSGVSLYQGSEDVRWLYVGCRCPACGLTACYGDWKNEFEGYRNLLSRV